MQRIVLDQLEPGALGIPGPVELEDSLAFAVECFRLLRANQ